MLMRVLLAVIAVVLTFALLGPVARVVGFPLSSDLMTILRIVVAGLAVLYIIRGRVW